MFLLACRVPYLRLASLRRVLLMPDEDRPRGRGGILARLESMDEEERLPILKELLPHLTNCQLSTDKACVAYQSSGWDVSCPRKGRACADCCPEHACEGALADPL